MQCETIILAFVVETHIKRMCCPLRFSHFPQLLRFGDFLMDNRPRLLLLLPDMLPFAAWVAPTDVLLPLLLLLPPHRVATSCGFGWGALFAGSIVATAAGSARRLQFV